MRVSIYNKQLDFYLTVQHLRMLKRFFLKKNSRFISTILLPVPLPSVNPLKINISRKSVCKKFRHNWSLCLVFAEFADRNPLILRIFCHLFVLHLILFDFFFSGCGCSSGVRFKGFNPTSKLHAFLNTIWVFGWG